VRELRLIRRKREPVRARGRVRFRNDCEVREAGFRSFAICWYQSIGRAVVIALCTSRRISPSPILKSFSFRNRPRTRPRPRLPSALLLGCDLNRATLTALHESVTATGHFPIPRMGTVEPRFTSDRSIPTYAPFVSNLSTVV
jgi:hypothetical protein